jgi:hypothetical protein
MKQREDTGRISAQLHAQVAQGTDTGGAERFLDAVADRLITRINGGPVRRRFLGLDAGSWMKLFLGWGIALGVFFATWYLSVRDGLRERPTIEQVERRVAGEVSEHEARGGAHPVIEKRLENVEAGQRVIRESQVRAEQVDATQTELLREVRDDVKKIRRTR